MHAQSSTDESLQLPHRHPAAEEPQVSLGRAPENPPAHHGLTQSHGQLGRSHLMRQNEQAAACLVQSQQRLGRSMCHVLNSRTSSRIRWITLSLGLSFRDFGMILTAASRRVALCTTSFTVPNPPFPRVSPTSKSASKVLHAFNAVSTNTLIINSDNHARTHRVLTLATE